MKCEVAFEFFESVEFIEVFKFFGILSLSGFPKIQKSKIQNPRSKIQMPVFPYICSPEVEFALHVGKPVVALESTVIAHGLPRPLNFETAMRLEKIVRDGGVTPATIALFKGQPQIGLTIEQIKYLAESREIRKLSIRDLPIAAAKNWDGATTVATTCFFAHKAGIRIFATGGIGGVHRGSLPDISADLPELAKTPISVVCSGAKIVLDLPATREWLETHGISVIGFGCDEMPAFYSQKSGLPIDARINSPAEAAEIVESRDKLGLPNAILFTVPVPKEAEVPAEELLDVLKNALHEADQKRIRGRAVTPFLLSQMAEKSKGATLKANVALLENNVRIATEIAKSLKPQEKR